MKKIAIFSLVSLFLSGCGPIYSTQYSYVPPKSTAGMHCISLCEVTRNSCEQSEARRKEDCEYRSRREYNWCKDHGDKNCFREFCHSDNSHCKDSYNSCYQACGGYVETDKVCTAFCNR